MIANAPVGCIGSPALTVSVTPAPANARAAAIAFAGELDRSNEREARGVLDRVLRSGVSCLVVDLGQLRFMDSSGVNLLARAYHALAQRHGTLAVVVRSGPVRRVLEVVRFGSFVPIYASLQDAFSELAPPEVPGPLPGIAALPPA